MDDRRTNPVRPNARRGALVASLVGVIYLVQVAWLIGTGLIPGRVANDQILYHEATVRLFMAQWPHVGFCDYYTATTPLYHILLALVGRMLGGQVATLQWGSAILGLPLVLAAGWYCGRRLDWPRALAFSLPLAASNYVVQSGAWLLPDNLGWVFVGLLYLLVFTRRFTPARLILGALLVLGAAWARQSHLWSAGLLWAWAWLSPQDPGPGFTANLVAKPVSRAGRVALAFVCTLPAFATIAYFHHLWHGLVVPRYQTFHEGINWSTPAFVLAVIGFVSVFFAPVLAGPLVEAWQRARWRLFVAALGAVAIAVAAPTTLSAEAGRISGLWSLADALARKLPFLVVQSHTSFVITGLAAFGAVALVAWLHRLWWHERVVTAATLAGFTAAQTANHHCWQRYIEPLVLLVVAVLATRISLERPRPRWWWLAVIGPVLLSGVYVSESLREMRGAAPIGTAIAPGEPPMGGWELRPCDGMPGDPVPPPESVYPPNYGPEHRVPPGRTHPDR